jgi:DNA polymerase III delta prime subunit
MDKMTNTNISVNEQEFLWAEKYRPQSIEDCVLTKSLKRTLGKFVTDGNITNLAFAGPPGIGKTTCAVALVKDLGADYILINGSLDNGVDVLRTTITDFASTVSFAGGRKYIIIDEADYMSANAQAGLRGTIEKFSANCGFILTCNYPNKIIGAISNSRFEQVDFTVSADEQPLIKARLFKRAVAILKMEQVEFEPAVVAQIVDKFYPDFRKVLGHMQTLAAHGPIDNVATRDTTEESFNALFEALNKKDFKLIRTWVAEQSNQDLATLYRQLFEAGEQRVDNSSMPGFVIIVADYMYKHGFVADPEINLVACLTEIMMECSFA